MGAVVVFTFITLRIQQRNIFKNKLLYFWETIQTTSSTTLECIINYVIILTAIGNPLANKQL